MQRLRNVRIVCSDGIRTLVYVYWLASLLVQGPTTENLTLAIRPRMESRRLCPLWRQLRGMGAEITVGEPEDTTNVISIVQPDLTDTVDIYNGEAHAQCIPVNAIVLCLLTLQLNILTSCRLLHPVEIPSLSLTFAKIHR